MSRTGRLLSVSVFTGLSVFVGVSTFQPALEKEHVEKVQSSTSLQVGSPEVSQQPLVSTADESPSQQRIEESGLSSLSTSQQYANEAAQLNFLEQPKFWSQKG